MQTELRRIGGSVPYLAMTKISSINTLLRSEPSLMISANVPFVYPI